MSIITAFSSADEYCESHFCGSHSLGVWAPHSLYGINYCNNPFENIFWTKDGDYVTFSNLQWTF